jgi:hypothetical protein
MTVGGKIGAKHLALFEARKSLEDAPERIEEEDRKSRPKSSYAGSVVASRIKNRGSSQVRS